MEYQSTRGAAARATAAEAIVTGLAADGGLYVPAQIPHLDARSLLGLEYPKTAARVLAPFLTEYDPAFLLCAAQAAYAGFDGKAGELARTRPSRYYLELWHGPTCAFKDYALQLMPRLLIEGKRLTGESCVTKILVATSGDTGKAALAGYAGLPGVKIAVFYPDDGTSEIQRLQMATQEGENVRVFAVKGNFDDAQTGVKRVFASAQAAEALAQRGEKLSSANSINWGRLAPQIAYYYYAYCKMVENDEIRMGETVDFCVPTGNFGDILAGWYAKRMGLPVGKLICASNENDVLTQFLSQGEYNANRPFHKTQSPSMDILVSSNLERLLFHVTQDAGQVAQWMDELARTGRYRVPDDVLRAIREDFACASVTAPQAAGEIRRVFESEGYLMDPHTAVASVAANRCAREETPCVVLSTASPYKFPASVLHALGEETPQDEFEAMRRLEAVSGTRAPASLRALQEKPVRFSRAIGKEDIAREALAF